MTFFGLDARVVRYVAAIAVVVLTSSLRSAHAEPSSLSASATVPHPYAYGILVGNNVGGPGQQPLRYAEDDARKMAEVLRQLGRFGAADMKVLARPDSATVLAAIDDVARKMGAHAAKGEQAVLIFYYSGHAKASAFSLGADELSVGTLRDRLRRIPSTLTLVILDACQSGQFARVKGTEPAADFSFNSVSRLTTKGVAVMASSSAEELSQESDELKGSYFTHHLVTALRGAADTDGDGRVSLDEAYRYAYRRTLSSTAETQVGSQHVTLETDLAGQGEVSVTYPADAKAQLELPSSLDAKVLVIHKPSGNVVAEVQKAPGAPLRLALAAGSYEATVRALGKILSCELTLRDERVTPIDLAGCAEVKRSGVAKGEYDDEPMPMESTPDTVKSEEPRETFRPWSAEAKTQVTPPSSYDGIRFVISKKGAGRAVLAVIRAQSDESCTAPPVVLHDQPLGVLCGDHRECRSNNCCNALCAECCPSFSPPSETGCNDGGACKSRVAFSVREDGFGASMPNQCNPGAHDRSAGAECVAASDCASGVCDGAQVSAVSPVAADGGPQSSATFEGCTPDLDDASAGDCVVNFVRGGKCR